MEYKVKAPIDGYLKYVYFENELVYGQETLFVITNKPCV